MIEKRFSLFFDKLIEFISNIDVALSSAKCALSMNLSRPIIEDGEFYEAIALNTWCQIHGVKIHGVR